MLGAETNRTNGLEFGTVYQQQLQKIDRFSCHLQLVRNCHTQYAFFEVWGAKTQGDRAISKRFWKKHGSSTYFWQGGFWEWLVACLESVSTLLQSTDGSAGLQLMQQVPPIEKVFHVFYQNNFEPLFCCKTSKTKRSQNGCRYCCSTETRVWKWRRAFSKLV